MLKMSKKIENNISRPKKLALHTIQGDADLTVLTTDKVNAMAALNISHYTEEVLAMIQCTRN
jgi:hypothetical protein